MRIRRGCDLISAANITIFQNVVLACDLRVFEKEKIGENYRSFSLQLNTGVFENERRTCYFNGGG